MPVQFPRPLSEEEQYHIRCLVQEFIDHGSGWGNWVPHYKLCRMLAKYPPWKGLRTWQIEEDIEKTLATGLLQRQGKTVQREGYWYKKYRYRPVWQAKGVKEEMGNQQRMSLTKRVAKFYRALSPAERVKFRLADASIWPKSGLTTKGSFYDFIGKLEEGGVVRKCGKRSEVVVHWLKNSLPAEVLAVDAESVSTTAPAGGGDDQISPKPVKVADSGHTLVARPANDSELTLQSLAQKRRELEQRQEELRQQQEAITSELDQIDQWEKWLKELMVMLDKIPFEERQRFCQAALS